MPDEAARKGFSTAPLTWLVRSVCVHCLDPALRVRGLPCVLPRHCTSTTLCVVPIRNACIYQLEEKRLSLDDKQFEQFVNNKACWKSFQVVCSIKRNEYMGKTTRRITVQSMRKINYGDETRRLIIEIQNFA